MYVCHGDAEHPVTDESAQNFTQRVANENYNFS